MDWREHVRLAHESADDSGKVIRECAAQAEVPTRFGGSLPPARPRTTKRRTPVAPGGLRGATKDDPDDPEGASGRNGAQRVSEGSSILEVRPD